MSLPVAAASSVAAAASLARGGRAPAAAVSLAAPRSAGVAARSPAGRGSAARAAAGSVGASASATDEVSFAIVGDLHLDPKDMELFYEARTQLRSALTDSTGAALPDARLIQLGDLGAYAAKPGSRACFQLASDFFNGFAPLPFSLVTGNHDLEGFDDFATDAENLAAWREQFRQHHHWAVRAGPYLLVGLSTVRFREAPGSCHEVYVDPAQLAWFEATLAANRDVPTLVFSHAPPMGSGLRVLQAVHVKNRCAWLNHGDAPQRFAEIAAVNPQIKLWFSGHFHLSHDYRDSVSIKGECAFVQVGVIGATSSRDGRRHSRLLRASAQGYQLYTVDHAAGGALRLDLSRQFDNSATVLVPPPPGDSLTCDPTKGWLCAEEDSEDAAARSSRWLSTGCGELIVQQNALVEYESRTRSPLGVVVRAVDGRSVRLVNAAGGDASGSAAVAVELRGADGGVERVARGRNGYFFQTFQENKYKKWLAAQAEKAAAAAGAAVPA